MDRDMVVDLGCGSEGRSWGWMREVEGCKNGLSRRKLKRREEEEEEDLRNRRGKESAPFLPQARVRKSSATASSRYSFEVLTETTFVLPAAIDLRP